MRESSYHRNLEMELPIFNVDSFASVPFSGNPAAVCLDKTAEGLSPELMQKIAAEMNLSETAFVRCLSAGDSFEKSDHFSLRWFTPTFEVPLCGHATLATAAALFKCVGNTSKKLDFATLQSGHLSAEKDGDFIRLQLPLNPPSPLSDLSKVEALVKATIGDVGPLDVQYAPAPMRKLLIRLPDSMTRSDLESLQPLIESFTSIHNGDMVRGIIVTRKADDSDVCGSLPYDFTSRYFAPWVAIPEDPVTGAAHTVLAAYWSKVLGKKELFARQCSKRGGDLKITVHEKEKKIDLAGPATVVMRGTLTI